MRRVGSCDGIMIFDDKFRDIVHDIYLAGRDLQRTAQNLTFSSDRAGDVKEIAKKLKAHLNKLEDFTGVKND